MKLQSSEPFVSALRATGTVSSQLVKLIILMFWVMNHFIAKIHCTIHNNVFVNTLCIHMWYVYSLKISLHFVCASICHKSSLKA